MRRVTSDRVLPLHITQRRDGFPNASDGVRPCQDDAGPERIGTGQGICPRDALQAEQGSEAFPNLREHFRWSLGSEDDLPRLPVEVLHVVGQNDAGDCARVGHRDFERIALHVTRDRASHGQARFGVVCAGRHDERGAAATLFMSRLGLNGQPDDIAGGGDVRARYHGSCPTGPPQSRSRWRLRGVILATNWSRE